VSSTEVDKDILAEYKNVQGTNFFSMPHLHVESATKIWSHVEEALKKGEILPLPYKVAPGGLGGVAEALESVKKVSGYKVVVHPQE
jgi:hypothetical protein